MFNWHMFIAKCHTYLWGADKQQNTDTGVSFVFFCLFCFWILRLVDCTDFEHNAANSEMYITWGTLHNSLFHWAYLLRNRQPTPSRGSRGSNAVMVKKIPHNCIPFYFQNLPIGSTDHFIFWSTNDQRLMPKPVLDLPILLRFNN